MCIMREGHALEVSVYHQAARDYPELNVRRASQDLDRRYATDLLVDLLGREIPVGLTMRDDDEKLDRDIAKAAQRFQYYVELCIQGRDDREQSFAIDNALCALLNDVPNLLKRKPRHRCFVVVIATCDSIAVHEHRL